MTIIESAMKYTNRERERETDKERSGRRLEWPSRRTNRRLNQTARSEDPVSFLTLLLSL